MYYNVHRTVGGYSSDSDADESSDVERETLEPQTASNLQRSRSEDTVDSGKLLLKFKPFFLPVLSDKLYYNT